MHGKHVKPVAQQAARSFVDGIDAGVARHVDAGITFAAVLK